MGKLETHRTITTDLHTIISHPITQKLKEQPVTQVTPTIVTRKR